MTDARRTEGQPHDRLTEIAAEMVTVLDNTPAADDIKAVVMLNDAERGGIVLHGYDDDSEAIADLFIHLKAIFEANGKQLMFAPMPGQG